jgi:hypothetical protein
VDVIAHFNPLDGRWTGQSRPVYDRQSMSVTAVKTVGRGGEGEGESVSLGYPHFYHTQIEDIIPWQLEQGVPTRIH